MIPGKVHKIMNTQLPRVRGTVEKRAPPYWIIKNLRSIQPWKYVIDLDRTHDRIQTTIPRKADLVVPDDDTMLESDDAVLVLVHNSHLDCLASVL